MIFNEQEIIHYYNNLESNDVQSISNYSLMFDWFTIVEITHIFISEHNTLGIC